jgi:glutamate N-acetyltransferase/amino-acid N-acetyltransferase
MAVGVINPSEIYNVAGVKLAAVKSAIRYPDRLDLVLIELAKDANVAGVFTQNIFCAAPVSIAKSHLRKASPRYFVINTGNANAGTGKTGKEDALNSCRFVAEIGKIPRHQVLPFSTGVIGEKLPIEKIEAALPKAFSLLEESSWREASLGILTTDTRPKLVSKKIRLRDDWVVITGMAKGSGMIKPNMATMLSYVFTDAIIEKDVLNQILNQVVNKSFNRITIDGDTSTNDACILTATGASKVAISDLNEEDTLRFYDTLKSVFRQLAIELIKDAEGATKFITIQVGQGLNESECLEVAYCIAESPLVKTALFASDPNWGRILAAIGRAEIKNLDFSTIEISIGDIKIISKGEIDDLYTEELVQPLMEKDEITISINLGRGECNEVVWTSDLSHDYIRINADYRT